MTTVADGALVEEVSVSPAGKTPAVVTAGEEARTPYVGLLTRVATADSTRAIAWRQRRLRNFSIEGKSDAVAIREQ